jgi:ATP-dependent protease ClpP protease subunit
MSEEDSDNESVYYHANTIYFFCSVTDASICDLCLILKKVSMLHTTVKLVIRSSGGDVYAGFAGMDYIRTLVLSGIVIETVVYGLCASAATFLFLAGTKRLMGQNAYVLIHQLSVDIGGTYNDLRDNMKTNKKLMKHFRKIYTEYTNMSSEMLDRVFTSDVILSAGKCLKYGIVHECI